MNKEKIRRFDSTPLQVNQEINQSTRLFDLSWPVTELSSVANLSYSALFWDACFLRMSGIEISMREYEEAGWQRLRRKNIPKSRWIFFACSNCFLRSAISLAASSFCTPDMRELEVVWINKIRYREIYLSREEREKRSDTHILFQSRIFFLSAQKVEDDVKCSCEDEGEEETESR
jgi:hypothetical protein